MALIVAGAVTGSLSPGSGILRKACAAIGANRRRRS
jgi:hypothetical protein